jgi:TRAP-type C4-dicarboxylate transport system substrate-binding protein
MDGMETSISNMYFTKIYEVQKYVSLTGHQYGTIPVLISEATWQKLSPDQQQAVLKAGEEAKGVIRRKMPAMEDEMLKDMEKRGLQISQVDKAAFLERASAVYKHFEPQFGKETLQKMLDLASTIRAKHPAK